ncbi:hypothetical protein PLICRDRAFT_36532 [Plicaturopsis crispa FD-325 SS-3]|nr:hypothetical protein PLICRDRAFT_36532 [Plicaturopsis crispa FD-325 SS-3]
MSSWNIGKDDVSEETQTLKNRLASKDTQCASLQGQLMKRDTELDELKTTLNETLHKLAHEANRALKLERDYARCSEDLRNEKIHAQNAAEALTAAQDKIKAEELASRELQTAIDTLSHRSDAASASQLKLEREKATLEARVRELQVEARPQRPPSTGIPRPARARSSSVNNFNTPNLEHELAEVRAASAKKDADLRSAGTKLARVQADLMKIENEKIAMEKEMQRRILDLENSLEEKEDELEHFRAQGGGCSREREEELLQRIDEDEAKIAAMETLLGDAQNMDKMKMALQKTEQQLRAEIAKVSRSEATHVELVREKEAALDHLEDARTEIASLRQTVQEKQDSIAALRASEEDLKQKLAAAELARPSRLDFSFDDKSTPRPQRTAAVVETPVKHDDEAVATYIERLLGAVDRLRDERDGLRRDLQFVETENRFTIQALEAKIASTSTSTTELDTLKQQFAEASAREADILRTQEKHTQRANFAAKVAGVIIVRLQSQVDSLAVHAAESSERVETLQSQLAGSLEEAREKEASLAETTARLSHVETQLEAALLDLRAAETRQEELRAISESKELAAESNAEDVLAEQQATAETVKQLEDQITELNTALEDVETQRNSLNLQVTNLQSDLESAQQELVDAESRYSTLQMHQLSSMSASDATRALRQQIEELEMRVLRRTEQIGVHQHDIKRLETNLRLQEERITEMTAELETLGAQKEAMVEDCADAREARDEAVQRVDALEQEVESLEERVEALEVEREQQVMAVVEVVADTVVRSRRALTDVTNVANKRATEDVALARKAEDLAQHHAVVLKDLASVRSDHADALQLLDKRQAIMSELQTSLRNSEDDARQITVALAMAQVSSRNHAAAFSASKAANNTLQTRVDELSALLQSNDAGKEMEALQTLHAAEVSDLSARLEQSTSELQDAASRLADLQNRHDEIIRESEEAKRLFDERLAALSSQIEAGEQLEHDLIQLRSDHTVEVQRLQERLDATEADAQQTKQAMADLELSNRQIVDELTQLKEDHERHLVQSSERTQAANKQFENELADLVSKHAEKLGDLQARLEHSEDEYARLQTRLQAEIDAHTKQQEVHTSELQALTERYQNANAAETELRQELATVRGQAVRATLEIQSLQEDRASLQIETTNLEAEIQRSLSLTRFLESQVKESEVTIASLRSVIEQTKADLSHSEQSGKAIEMELTLQVAQHERLIAGLRREVSTLRAVPSLEGVVAELQEKNQEMEELLRNKCAEIEDNDDRFIEMLKEKKKLVAKVDSLTRKVTNLQTKVTAAKERESFTAAQSAPTSIISSRATQSPAVPPVPSLPPVRAMASVPSARTPSASAGPAAHARATSGPSTVPRPKTPERSVHPTVFKARTPERGRPSSSTPPTETEMPSAGKKRRLPDDFEEAEQPRQAIVADGLRSDSSTPRLRRVISGPHTGFTPVRHHATRTTPSQLSPIRRVTAGMTRTHAIADVTNSPRSFSQANPSTAKASKRSWLGKIRNTGATPSAPRPASAIRHSVFERGPGERS